MKKDNKIEAIAVSFNDDNVSALYLNGQFVAMNNDYDDNSMLSFESFISGATWAGKNVGNIEWLRVYGQEDDFPSNDGSNIPEKWPDNKYSKRVK